MPTLNLFLKHSRFFHSLISSLISISNFFTHIFITQFLHPSHHHGSQSLNTDTSSDLTTLTSLSSTFETTMTFTSHLSAQPSSPDSPYLISPNSGTFSHKSLKKWPVVNPFHSYSKNIPSPSSMKSLLVIVFFVLLAWGWTKFNTTYFTRNLWLNTYLFILSPWTYIFYLFTYFDHCSLLDDLVSWLILVLL